MTQSVDTALIFFGYQKDGKTKFLNFEEATAEGEQLLADGWNHIETLNAKIFLEHLFNEGAQERFEAARRYLAGLVHDETNIETALQIAAGTKQPNE